MSSLLPVNPMPLRQDASVVCKIDPQNDIHTAISLCAELQAAVSGQYKQGKSDSGQPGLFNQVVTNLRGGYGNRLFLMTGQYYPRGVCLRFCPFCGGKLLSDEEAEMVACQVEIALKLRR